MKFSSDYQPKNRKPRGLGKKTLILNEYKELFNSKNINAIEILETVIELMFSKDVLEHKDLELMTAIATSLLKYQLVEKSNISINEVEESNEYKVTSTDDIIKGFISNE